MLEYDLTKLSEAIKIRRDLSFKYLGIQILADRYFIREEGKIMEAPQSFWMRVAMGLALNEEDKEAMGKRRAAYLQRTSGDVKRRQALLGVKLEPGEEVDDFLIRTQEAADNKKANKEWEAFTKREGYVSPEMQSRFDAQDAQNAVLKGQLAEQIAARKASDKANAQARLDAINAQTAQLEYMKGRDSSDMRRFELLLDREDRKDAAERRRAMIEGFVNLGGAFFQ